MTEYFKSRGKPDPFLDRPKSKFVAVSDRSERSGVVGNPETFHPYAEVHLKHEQEVPQFGMREGQRWNKNDNTGEWERDADEYADVGHDSYGRNSRELFKNRRGEISYAAADPSMKSHVGNLLGMAIREHQRLTGSKGLPIPDSSLSVHSSKLVQNARNKGVDVPTNIFNPNAVSNNHMTYEPLKMGLYEYSARIGGSMDQSTEEDINEGRTAVRSLLRHPKPSTVTHPQQFGTQGKLF